MCYKDFIIIYIIIIIIITIIITTIIIIIKIIIIITHYYYKKPAYLSFFLSCSRRFSLAYLWNSNLAGCNGVALGTF